MNNTNLQIAVRPCPADRKQTACVVVLDGRFFGNSHFHVKTRRAARVFSCPGQALDYINDTKMDGWRGLRVVVA